jgi:DNA repair protein RecN (Recombination protein N)
MAKKLRELAEHRQVIAISHLPQIAGQARHQWRIEKALVNSRSVTRLLRLAPEERVVELARMLAGETITPSAMANARELLADPVEN